MLSRYAIAISAMFIASASQAAPSDTDPQQEAQAILDIDRCEEFRLDDPTDVTEPGFLAINFLHLGCAAQTIASGNSMENPVLINTGVDELKNAITRIQTALNIYNEYKNNFLPDDESRDNLTVSGIMDKLTRAFLYEYAHEFNAHEIFYDTAIYPPLSAESGYLFYLRQYLDQQDHDQYLQAFQDVMTNDQTPLQIPDFGTLSDFAAPVCETQTPRANPLIPCPEI